MMFTMKPFCRIFFIDLCVAVYFSKDKHIKQLEIEIDQERRMTESLVADMVS